MTFKMADVEQMDIDTVDENKMKSASQTAQMDVDLSKADTKDVSVNKSGKKSSKGFELPW